MKSKLIFGFHAVTARLRLDANGAWERRQAERWMERCAERPVEHVEQPCLPGPGAGETEKRRTDDLLLGLANDFPTPIALDESLAGDADLARWLAMLRPLCDAIGELLWLTRQGGKVRSEVASSGIFHITFERDQTLQLLRISVPAASNLYPEVSGNQMRCSIRFLAWGEAGQRPQQSGENISFVLTCCH